MSHNHTNTAAVKSPDGGHVPPSTARFQTAWTLWWVKPWLTFNT